MKRQRIVPRPLFPALGCKANQGFEGGGVAVSFKYVCYVVWDSGDAPHECQASAPKPLRCAKQMQSKVDFIATLGAFMVAGGADVQ